MILKNYKWKNKTVEEDSWESITTVNVDDSGC